jgi:hypothetical protein
MFFGIGADVGTAPKKADSHRRFRFVDPHWSLFWRPPACAQLVAAMSRSLAALILSYPGSAAAALVLPLLLAKRMLQSACVAECMGITLIAA